MVTMGNKFTTILLVLLSTNLFLLLSNLSPTSLEPKPVGSAFDPVEFIFSRLSVILMLYISSLPYSLHQPISLHSLLFKIQKTWHRPALTLLCIELYYTASASLLLMLKSLASKATASCGGAIFSEAAVILGCIGSLLWLWPALFEHSEIACKMGLVMSVVEEEGGIEAVKRAGAMVEGRKFEGFVLTAAMAVVERAASEGLVGLVVRVLVWFVYTGFYYECKRVSNGKGKISLLSYDKIK